MSSMCEDFRHNSGTPLGEQAISRFATKDRKRAKAEYVWIDDSQTINSKTITIPTCVKNISGLPLERHLSCYTLRPVAIFDDITECEKSLLVLCEVDNDLLPKSDEVEKKRTVHRKLILSSPVVEADLRFSIEQEFLFEQCVDMTNFPVGKVRKITDAFYEACFNANIPVDSVTYKNAPDECWSYKVGPCTSQQAADMLWMSRYIIKRISEDYDLTVTFNALNGIRSGADPAEEFRPCSRYQVSVSLKRSAITNRMEALKNIELVYKELMNKSEYHMDQVYGRECQNSMHRVKLFTFYDKFSEYLEDSRPAGNSDPYDVISFILQCFAS